MGSSVGSRFAPAKGSLKVHCLESEPLGAGFKLLSELVADVVQEVVAVPQVAWVSIGGVPLLVPVAEGRVAVNVPGESDLDAVEVPAFVAGLLICIFALEYGVFTDSGTTRVGVAANIRKLKYTYLGLLKLWCAGQSVTTASAVLELVE